MIDGALVHATRRRRVAVRPEVLPELVAVLALRLVWARRALLAAEKRLQLDPSETSLAMVKRWERMIGLVEELIATAGDTMHETEYALCLSAAEKEVKRYYATPRPRSGRRIGVPRDVPAKPLTSGGRSQSAWDDLPRLSGGPGRLESRKATGDR